MRRARQVLPDAEEERPPYFAGYGNVDFIQVSKHIFGEPTARKNNMQMAFVIIAAEIARTAREIIIEQNMAAPDLGTKSR
jgi:hypothetical protein